MVLHYIEMVGTNNGKINAIYNEWNRRERKRMTEKNIEHKRIMWQSVRCEQGEITQQRN